MKILVIGGSYFYGRVFVMLASKMHDITVVNRGTYSMEEFGVKQISGDRHDALLWQQCRDNYDVIVDFCAYTSEDIEIVLKNLKAAPAQYILISTVDVYRRQGTGELKGESAPIETRVFPGDLGSYISGKVALEEELRRECGKRGIDFTILRPAILYGPYNYAPRESLFIQLMVRDRVLPEFTDAEGRFQFLYVKDAAEAILRCMGKRETYGQAYNLCGDEIVDYELFFRTLRECAEEEICKVPMTLAEAERQGLAIPFPATAAETELVSNTKSRQELGMEYTVLAQGLQKTYNAFKHVYQA